MSLDKAIQYGKEKRNNYYGVKAIDKQCRNHGACPYCRSDCLYKIKKLEESKKDEY